MNLVRLFFKYFVFIGSAVLSMSWSDHVYGKGRLGIKNGSVDGKLRFRFEATKVDENEMQFRQRIRVSVKAKGKINKRVAFKIRLATGDVDRGAEGNDVFGEDGEKNDFTLDRWNIKWAATRKGRLFVGKVGSPIVVAGSNDTHWDGANGFEGFTYQHNKGGAGIWSNSFAYWIREDSSGSDVGLLGTQWGYRLKVGDGAINIGTGIWSYPGIKGQPFISGFQSGNLDNGNGEYANDFTIANGLLSMDIFAFGLPMKPYFDFYYNMAAGEQALSFIGGVTVGRYEKLKDWQFIYYYVQNGRDSMVGAFSNGDNGGGSDNRGHVFGYRKKLWKNIEVFLRQYLLAETRISTDNPGSFNRTRLDFSFSY